MKKALIIGNSGGIGQAIETQLLAGGWQVQGFSRSKDGLDFNDPGTITDCMAQVSGPVTRVIVATGMLATPGNQPEKSLGRLELDHMQAVFMANTFGPAMVLKHLPKILDRSAPSQVMVLSARVGSISDNQLGGWYSYRASKAALNQILKCTAIEMARSHPQACCVAMHPGTVATEFTKNYQAVNKIDATQAAIRLMDVLDNLSPSQTGQFLDNRGQEIGW